MFDLLLNRDEFKAAIALLAQEQYEAVVELLKPVITQSADNLDESLLVLSAYLGLMRYELAERLSLRMMATYPDDVRALYGRSLYLYHTKMFTLGLHYIRKALKRNSYNADILALAGALAFETRAIPDAVNYINSALELNPTHPLAADVYGIIHHAASENAASGKINEQLSDKHASVPLDAYSNQKAPPQTSQRVLKPRSTPAQAYIRLQELITRQPKYLQWLSLAIIVIGLGVMSVYKLHLLGCILVILIWFPLWWWSSDVYKLIFQPNWYKSGSHDKILPFILFAVLVLTLTGAALALYGVVKPLFLITALNCWACIYVLSYYQAYRHTRALTALVLCVIGLMTTLLATWSLNKILFYVAAFIVTVSMLISYSENKS